MPDNIMMLNFNMNQVNIEPHAIAGTNANTSNIPGIGGQNGQPPASFADIMHAVLSGLEKGVEGLKKMLAVNADGKAISMEELMQKLFAGDEARTDDGKTMTADALQQMMAQAQIAGFVQPVIPVKLSQLSDAAPDLNNNVLNMRQGSNNSIIDLMEKPGGEAQKIRIDTGGTSFPQMKSMTEPDGLQAEAMPSPGSVIAEPKAAPAINMTAADNNADNKNISMLVKDMPSTVQPGRNITGIMKDGAVKEPAGNSVPVPTNDNSAAMVNKVLMANNDDPGANVDLVRLSPGPDKAAVSQFSAALNTDAEIVESKARISGVHAGVIPDTKPLSGDGDGNALASTTQLQQTSYAKNEVKAKETVHISRLNELSEPIMKTLGAGNKQVVIKIEPPELGNVQIRLRMENGVLKVDFRVDSPAVKELFSMAMPHIKSSIEGSGVKAGEFFVDVRDQQHSDGRGQHDDARQQQNKQQKEADSNFFDYFA